MQDSNSAHASPHVKEHFAVGTFRNPVCDALHHSK